MRIQVTVGLFALCRVDLGSGIPSHVRHRSRLGSNWQNSACVVSSRPYRSSSYERWAASTIRSDRKTEKYKGNKQESSRAAKESSLDMPRSILIYVSLGDYGLQSPGAAGG